MLIRCRAVAVLVAFLVASMVPAQARFISGTDMGRLKTHLKAVQSHLGRAQRALDDKTPDELRFALNDLKRSLLDAAPLYKKFRGTINGVIDRLYQNNAAYGHPKMWPDSEAEKLDRYRSEASDITATEKLAEFMLQKIDESLARLANARKAGINPLDTQFDMYQSSIQDLAEYIQRYKDQIDKLEAYR